MAGLSEVVGALTEAYYYMRMGYGRIKRLAGLDGFHCILWAHQTRHVTRGPGPLVPEPRDGDDQLALRGGGVLHAHLDLLDPWKEDEEWATCLLCLHVAEKLLDKQKQVICTYRV